MLSRDCNTLARPCTLCSSLRFTSLCLDLGHFYTRGLFKTWSSLYLFLLIKLERFVLKLYLLENVAALCIKFINWSTNFRKLVSFNPTGYFIDEWKFHFQLYLIKILLINFSRMISIYDIRELKVLKRITLEKTTNIEYLYTQVSQV